MQAELAGYFTSELQRKHDVLPISDRQLVGKIHSIVKNYTDWIVGSHIPPCYSVKLRLEKMTEHENNNLQIFLEEYIGPVCIEKHKFALKEITSGYNGGLLIEGEDLALSNSESWDHLLNTSWTDQF